MRVNVSALTFGWVDDLTIHACKSDVTGFRLLLGNIAHEFCVIHEAAKYFKPKQHREGRSRLVNLIHEMENVNRSTEEADCVVSILTIPGTPT